MISFLHRLFGKRASGAAARRGVAGNLRFHQPADAGKFRLPKMEHRTTVVEDVEKDPRTFVKFSRATDMESLDAVFTLIIPRAAMVEQEVVIFGEGTISSRLYALFLLVREIENPTS